MSIIICSPKYKGCGHWAEGRRFDTSQPYDKFDDLVICPVCHEDHAFQVLPQNIDSLTEGMSSEEREKIRQAMEADAPQSDVACLK